jgi:hypothetical protein
MALVLPNQGEDLVLEAITNKTAPQALKLKLFKLPSSDPGETATESSFTEADFTGYSEDASITWGSSSGSTITGDKSTFTSSAGSQNQDVYGYYLVQTTSGKLVWYEYFVGGPYNIANNGDKIEVTPAISAA